MKTQHEATELHKNTALNEEVLELREKVGNQEDLESTVEVLRSKLEVTEKNSQEY